MADFDCVVTSGWEAGVDACGPIDMGCYIVGINPESAAVCEVSDKEHVVDWIYQLVFWKFGLGSFTLCIEHNSSIPSI